MACGRCRAYSSRRPIARTVCSSERSRKRCGARNELGVTVNSVAPGFIPVERHANVTDEVKTAYPATVPAGYLGSSADVAHAVSFFASEAAGFITGRRVVVDGGRGLAA